MPICMIADGTIGPDVMSTSRAKQRYLLLVAQLRDDFIRSKGVDPHDDNQRAVKRAAYGWQKQVSEQLRINPSHLSRALATERSQRRGLSIDYIEHAIRGFGVHPSFFFGAFSTPPNYRDFVGPHTLTALMGYHALHEFLANAPRLGLEITPAEQRVLEDQDWPAEPTTMSYMHLLSGLRACAAPAVADHSGLRGTSKRRLRGVE